MTCEDSVIPTEKFITLGDIFGFQSLALTTEQQPSTIPAVRMSNQTEQPARPRSRSDENNVCLIGIEGAGKSTCAGLILLTALDIANTPSNKATLLIEEKTLPIRTIADALRKGFFPPSTPRGESFEAFLNLKFKQRVRTLAVNIGITDIAGETLREVMDYIASGRFEMPDAERIHDANRFVLDASSFLLVVDLQRLILQQKTDSQDAEFSRFIDLLMRWKKFSKRSPRTKCIGLVFTKYDTVKNMLAADENISLDSDNGRQDFMNKFMPQTSLGLRSKVTERVINTFYSSVKLETDEEGRSTGRIRLIPGKRWPVYSVKEYARMISWLRSVLR